jgi:hypothetical protein
MILFGHIEFSRYRLIFELLLSLQISHIVRSAHIQVLRCRCIVFFIYLLCGDIEEAFGKSVAAG